MGVCLPGGGGGHDGMEGGVSWFGLGGVRVGCGSCRLKYYVGVRGELYGIR